MLIALQCASQMERLVHGSIAAQVFGTAKGSTAQCFVKAHEPGIALEKAQRPALPRPLANIIKMSHGVPQPCAQFTAEPRAPGGGLLVAAEARRWASTILGMRILTSKKTLPVARSWNVVEVELAFMPPPFSNDALARATGHVCHRNQMLPCRSKARWVDASLDQRYRHPRM